MASGEKPIRDHVRRTFPNGVTNAPGHKILHSPWGTPPLSLQSRILLLIEVVGKIIHEKIILQTHRDGNYRHLIQNYSLDELMFLHQDGGKRLKSQPKLSCVQKLLDLSRFCPAQL
jgi:hypothetical protein